MQWRGWNPQPLSLWVPVLLSLQLTDSPIDRYTLFTLFCSLVRCLCCWNKNYSAVWHFVLCYLINSCKCTSSCFITVSTNGADRGICVRGPVPHLPLLSPIPLRTRPLKPVRESGERCKLPIGVRTKSRPKTNLVHSKAARNHYSGNHFEYSEYHVFQ